MTDMVKSLESMVDSLERSYATLEAYHIYASLLNQTDMYEKYESRLDEFKDVLNECSRQVSLLLVQATLYHDDEAVNTIRVLLVRVYRLRKELGEA